MTEGHVRHIVNLSGGKDSTALAIYLRDRIPDLEYVFCDTRKELPETYEYLDRLEAYLGRPVVRLDNGRRDFDHYLALRRGFLPSPKRRWCTELLKIRPLERYVGDDHVLSYVGLRADEHRSGHISTKPNIQPVFPFKEHGLALRDVLRILERSSVGLPGYYRWRSRSGCFFCFFQKKIEWVGLLENHPGLFEEACRYEKSEEGPGYTWCDDESLEQLAKPERIAQIRMEHAAWMQLNSRDQTGRTLSDVFTDPLSAEAISEVIRTWEL
jgi:hypothetical protein